MGFSAFLLKYLEIWQLIGLSFSALFFIILILPKISKFGFRDEDVSKGYPIGGVFYTFSIILSLLIFPLYIAGAAWIIMAFGDGTSTLIGKHYGKRNLFWNKKKSYIGFVSFILFAWIGSVAIIFWLSDLSPMPWWTAFEIFPENHLAFLFLIDRGQIIITCFLTSLFCAVIESLPIKINDNLTVPILGSLFMFFTVLII